MQNNFAQNTWFDTDARKARALCDDGVARTFTIKPSADTFFSIPARGKVQGRPVKGFVMLADNDSPILRFHENQP